jgi:hypothetical protein
MTTTISTEDLANVPHPSGATFVDEWDNLPPDANRYWYGTSRRVVLGKGLGARLSYRRDVQVRIAGSQHTDGQVVRYVEVEDVDPDSGRATTDDPITSAEARAWAEALLAAADEIDQMTARGETA